LRLNGKVERSTGWTTPPLPRSERLVFVAEAFYNRHNVLIMMSEQKVRRFGPRIRVAAG
jgi:hypothetical protein